MNLQKYFTTDRALPLNEIPTNMILLYIYILYTTRHAYRTDSTTMVLRTVSNIFLNAFSKPRSTMYSIFCGMEKEIRDLILHNDYDKIPTAKFS